MTSIENILYSHNSKDYFTMPTITYNQPMKVAIDKILSRSPFSDVSEYLEYHVKQDTLLLKQNPNKKIFSK